MMKDRNLDSYDVKENDVHCRIEIVDSREAEEILIQQYRNRGFKVLGAKSVYRNDDTYLLRPTELLERFKAIRDRGQFVISGISCYLRLWDKNNVVDFFNVFKNIIDSTNGEIILVVQNDVFQRSVFSNPRYYAGKIVHLRSSKENKHDDSDYTVTILDAGSAPEKLIVDSY